MSHPPPYRALEAMHVGRLRPSHLRVVEHHLAACEGCRTALACIATYERVSGEFRALEPAIDWDTVSHGALRAIRRRRDQRFAFVGVALVAAAAVALVVAIPTRRPSTSAVHQPPALVAGRAEVRPVVSHAAGNVIIDGATLSVREARPRSLHDGSVLETTQGSLRVSLGTGTGFELGPSTVLRLDAVRAPIALSLESGRVSSEVRPGTAYEVHAGPYVIRVRGTHFDVERAGSRVSVHLHSGRVEVIENGVSLGVLVAPATWTSPEAPEATAPTPAPSARPRTTQTRAMATPDASTTVVPQSDAADVAFAMRRHASVLSRCIASDSPPVSFTIHFSVGVMGDIRDVSLSSRSEVPTSVSDCVLRTVQGFRVPAPDDPLDLSLPITLP